MVVVTTPVTRAPSQHWPALDGLRGVALLGVFAYHAGWLSAGFLGVSLFFTLSGFLITTLLLGDRRSHGRIRLGRFWSRRIRRLVPAALLTVGAIALIEQWSSAGDIASSVRGDLWAAALWVANWRFIFGDVGYAEEFADPSPVLHFWSLAIEEQFYIVFPLVCALLLARRRVFSGALVVGIVASVAWSLSLAASGRVDRAYFDTGARASELLVGALAAVLVVGWAPSRQAMRRLDALSIVGCIGLAITWVVADLDSWLLPRGGFVVHALVAAAIVITARDPETLTARAFSHRWLRAVGLASYGAYLFHWPIMQYLDADVMGFDGVGLVVVWAALTAALAWLSYHWFEQPIRRLRRPKVSWQPVAASAAALLAVVFVALAADVDSVRPRAGVIGEFATLPSEIPDEVEVRTAPAEVDATPPPTDPPAETPDLIIGGEAWQPPDFDGVPTVAVIGDSVVYNLGEGLARWAERTGSLAVYQRSYPGCSVLDIAPIFQPWDPDHPLERACYSYDGLVQEFRQNGVDTVLIGASGMDALPRLHEGEWTEVGMSEAFDQRLRDEYVEMITTFEDAGFPVVWMNLPCNRDPRPVDRLDGRSLAEYLVQEIQDPVIDSRDEIPTIDVDSLICPGGEFQSTLGPVSNARPDGGHLAEPAADWVAEQVIAPALLILHWPI